MMELSPVQPVSGRTGPLDTTATVPRSHWPAVSFVTLVFVLATVSMDGLFWQESAPSMVEARLSAMQTGMLNRRIALILLGIVSIVGLLRSRSTRIRLRGGQAVLLGIAFLLAVASLGWADERALVLRKLVAQVLLVTGALWYATDLVPGRLVSLALTGTLFTICLGIVVEVANGVFLPWAEGYRLMGFVHPNQTAEYAGFAILAAVTLTIHRETGRTWYLALSALGVLLLALTRSRTALIATLIGVAVLLWLVTRRSARGQALVVIGVTTVAVLAGLVQVFGQEDLPNLAWHLLGSGRADSELSTLTGRTLLWDELIRRYLVDRPLLGYGFEGFWTSGRIIELSLLQPGHAYFHSHSGYLELALGIGIPGALLYTGGILLCLRQGVRDYRSCPSADTALVVAVIGYMLTSMLAEASNLAVSLTAFIAWTCLLRTSFVRLEPSEAPAASYHRLAAATGPHLER